MLRSPVSPRGPGRKRFRLPTLTLTALVVALAACGEPPVTDDGANDDGSDDGMPDDGMPDDGMPDDGATDGEPSGWMEIGWGQDEFQPLEDGGEFEIVWGTQGSAMFPIIVRGGDFPLPPMPDDWQHEAAP
ncbi:MAG: hypothetical protein AAF721_42210, partial [Myxococcota bacterium]